ncbi:hypothetical protein [Aminicella lysinilytica]|uniref:Uncharacterized protein n=1 Tax=Aminicella lysinilytica TaxID=433323 RepID=A0A4V3CRD7_9FIRM|nr:hypothetical protein [Aminicella lysinilytica]NLD10292.1 hypothetical protein [Clostridiales bacterium]TDP56452.1 hypothetical protein EV211_11426 [Aminicella lysinilytica]
MKTIKLILGIISLVLSVFIGLQSSAAGLYNTLSDNGQLGGTAGLFLVICLVIAGIVAIVTRNGGKGGAFTAAGFYIFGALLGYANAGSYSDLYIWSTVSLVFGVVFIIGTLISQRKSKKNN